MILSMPKILFFQSVIDEQWEVTLAKKAREEEGKILCKVCQHVITFPTHKIEVNGQHHHVFTNPSGLTFEIGCFSLTPGAVNTGTATLEYTWFQGYSWQITLCKHCLTHLGWFYQAASHDSFYGLILGNLRP